MLGDVACEETGEAAPEEVGEAALGKVAYDETSKDTLSEAACGEAGEAMLIKIRVWIRHGPWRDDAIQSSGSF